MRESTSALNILHAVVFPRSLLLATRIGQGTLGRSVATRKPLIKFQPVVRRGDYLTTRRPTTELSLKLKPP